MISSTNSSFIKTIIKQSMANDFMNIEKANKHFKKAFGINLKDSIEKNIWDNIIDIVNLRNTIVHNHGKIDNTFKEKKTYENVKQYINGDLVFLTEELLDKYIESVMEMEKILSTIFLEKISEKMHSYIANYYFNNYPILFIPE